MSIVRCSARQPALCLPAHAKHSTQHAAGLQVQGQRHGGRGAPALCARAHHSGGARAIATEPAGARAARLAWQRACRARPLALQSGAPSTSSGDTPPANPDYCVPLLILLSMFVAALGVQVGLCWAHGACAACRKRHHRGVCLGRAFRLPGTGEDLCQIAYCIVSPACAPVCVPR